MSNYAILETGSKQYWVEPDSVIDVELIKGADEKKEVTFDKVLFVKDGEKVHVGQPLVKGAKVVCDYLGEFRAPKVISFKFHRRKSSKKIRGHRQELMKFRVKKIQVS